jgi:hypothetical protein
MRRLRWQGAREEGYQVATLSWSRRFDEPILLPNGRKLVTLRDAGEYIAGLPAKDQKAPQWERAAKALMLVVESGGPTMMARIGMMQAISHGRP